MERNRPSRLWRAFAFTDGERRSIVAIVGLTIAAGALGAVEPLLYKTIVDGLVAGERVRPIIYGVGALLALYLMRESATAFGNWLMWRVRLRVQHRLLDATVGRLHGLSIAYHRSQSVGSLLTKLDRGIQGVVTAFSQIAFALVPACVFLMLAAILTARLEWRLSLLLFVLLPLPAVIGVVAAPVQTRRDRSLLERWTRIYGRFNEVLGGIITVKSFAMEHEEKQRFIRQVEQTNVLVAQGVGFDSRVTAAQQLIVGVTRVAIVGYGAYLVWIGQTSVGTLLAFVGFLQGLFGPVQNLTTLYQTVRRAGVSLDTIFSILETEEAVSDAPGARAVESLRGEVELENVWFGYQSDRFVLRGINLRVPSGQTVALVGPSGAGKTSLIVLLQRLYDPQEGAIRIDGLDLRAMTQRSLRRQIGVVLQDASLFDDSIRANIAYGRPEATRAEIEAAARAANAHEFVSQLPGGYDYDVGERGGRLSAGQRQRIAIARALLRDPPIVILDEATSALDAESESLVQQALGRLLQGRTTFVIAHRLSTIVNAHQILVIRGGRIHESGTHRELMKSDGYYAQLVALQTRGLVSTSPGDDAEASAG